MNLIPNGSFEAGLKQWESTPSGVTFIKNETKRFVMLAAERHSAAICSVPISVVPGAAYRVEVERAIRGDCDISVIGKETLLRPDASGEIVAQEERVRVQVTARPGNRVGVGRVLVRPVGPRARLLNLRSTVAFRKPGTPFEILCEIRNTGSAPIVGAAIRFESEKHVLLEDHKQEIHPPDVAVGGAEQVSWQIAAQRTANAPYRIVLEYAGGRVETEGATLKHVPRLPETKPVQSVAGSKKWFTVGTRAIRLTAHETDLDFGPSLLTTAEGYELGVVHAPAQIALARGGIVPLMSEVKAVGAGGVDLEGRNPLAEWSLSIRPQHSSRGITLDLRIHPRKRVPEANLEIAPFQSTLPLRFREGRIFLPAPKGDVRLGWKYSGKLKMEFEVSEASSLAVLRSELVTLTPAIPIRITATLHPAESAIIRGE